MADEALKIISMRIVNVMAIRAIEIAPEGAPVVTVTGRNAQGKTATLLSIAMALGGKRAMVERALRDGQKKGEIFLDLGRYQIRRRLTAKGTYLSVTADGKEVAGPQVLLDELNGVIMQPMDFIRRSPKEQAEILRELAGVDFSDLDQRRAALYEQRTDANREAKRLRSHAASLPVYGDAPDEPIDTAELATELEQLKAEAKRHDDLRYEARQAEDALARAQAHHAQIKLELAKAEAEMKAAYEADAQAKAQLIGLEDAEYGPVMDQLRDAGEINRRVAANQTAADTLEAAEEAERKARDLTQQIEGIDEEKAALLAASPLPVAGLSYTDDGVTFKGVPFSQASQAQQIKIACALKFAKRPAIRIMLVPDASLLDEESRATLLKIAEHHDAQIFEEIVNSDDPAAIRIEGGVVVD